MSALDWFKRILGETPGAQGQTEAALKPADDAAAEFGGLNFKTAIDAHMKWKTRLESYIDGTSKEDLKVEVVSRDDQCPLGKWIYSTGGSQFGGIDTFTEMRSHHSAFHQCAGKILSAAQSGKKAEALHLLHHCDYSLASAKVKRLLAKLYVRLNPGT